MPVGSAYEASESFIEAPDERYAARPDEMTMALDPCRCAVATACSMRVDVLRPPFLARTNVWPSTAPRRPGPTLRCRALAMMVTRRSAIRLSVSRREEKP